MSDLVSPRIRAFAASARPARPLPAGYGLLLGAAVSLGLWAGIAVAIIRLWP